MPPLRRYRNGPRPTRGRTLCAPTASSELVLLARQSQAQVWSRTCPKFLQTQGPVARREFRVSLRFCAPEIFCLAQGIAPVMGGPGVSRHWRTKFASAASPGDPLVPFPSLGKEPAPQGGTPFQTARRGRRALQNEESSARRPQAAKLPQNTEKDKPRGAYPQGLSRFKI